MNVNRRFNNSHFILFFKVFDKLSSGERSAVLSGAYRKPSLNTDMRSRSKLCK